MTEKSDWNPLFPAILVGTVFLSMCLTSDNTDITAVVKLLPDVQQFLNEHPDAEIKAALWSTSSVDANIEGIRKDCGPQMESKGYWKAEVKEKNLNLIIWLDNETRQPVCVVKTGISAVPLPSTTSSAPTANKAATSTTSPATSASKTLLQLQDLDDVLLNGNDVAPGYTINQFRTGVIDDALQYHEGNAESARELVKYGWNANKAIQFDYEIANVTGAKYIRVSASLYDKPTEYFACSMNWRLEDFQNFNWQRLEGLGQDIELGSITTTSFGAPLTVYEVRGYYSNVFVNLDLGGYARSVTKEEAKGYAKLISDRLKLKCPNCSLSPLQCSLAKSANTTTVSSQLVTSTNATIFIQDVGRTPVGTYLSRPSVQVANNGNSDLSDLTFDITLLKDGRIVKKDVDVLFMSGYNAISSVSAGSGMIGTLNYMSPTDLNGHYTLRIDLRKGASTRIIATDSKDVDIP